LRANKSQSQSHTIYTAHEAQKVSNALTRRVNIEQTRRFLLFFPSNCSNVI